MKNDNIYQITEEMLADYYDLSQRKKEIEYRMEELKKIFHGYFDLEVGQNANGEIEMEHFKVQRTIRNTEKFDDAETVYRLEELKLNDLVQIIKKPDGEKIKSAIHLGFLDEKDLEGCIVTNSTQAIYVKPLKSTKY
ncbi:hypothetical protein J5Y03_04965 [Bacillus sp. RG28]|uniref:Uncharacterized protein n=1 Tax=Gottfriedia endophytica TaxID=2820819 RepID=A0A940NL47_9BACI|nr:hypothetical protein [Gottfriedia endophytica]MBP0724536.1 hypothetical protein [Gottfriedia endophytica]